MGKGTRKRKFSGKFVRPLGRPRAFDPEKALDRALQVFWRKGYEGASLSDLTKAMRINRPSLYSAFGNKEGLFRKVLDRYTDNQACYVRQALSETTARAVAEKMLQSAAEMLTDARNPRGCLIVQGALSCGDSATCIRDELKSRRAESQAAILERLKRAKSEGDLPADADARELARFLATVVHGMSVQSASGATRDELRQVARTALRAFPG